MRLPRKLPLREMVLARGRVGLGEGGDLAPAVAASWGGGLMGRQNTPPGAAVNILRLNPMIGYVKFAHHMDVGNSNWIGRRAPIDKDNVRELCTCRMDELLGAAGGGGAPPPGTGPEPPVASATGRAPPFGRRL